MRPPPLLFGRRARNCQAFKLCAQSDRMISLICANIKSVCFDSSKCEFYGVTFLASQAIRSMFSIPEP
jgi:hypothetical protein